MQYTLIALALYHVPCTVCCTGAVCDYDIMCRFRCQWKRWLSLQLNSSMNCCLNISCQTPRVNSFETFAAAAKTNSLLRTVANVNWKLFRPLKTRSVALPCAVCVYVCMYVCKWVIRMVRVSRIILCHCTVRYCGRKSRKSDTRGAARKTHIESTAGTWFGKLFHVRAAITGNVLSPKINREDEAERSQWWASTFTSWQRYWTNLPLPRCVKSWCWERLAVNLESRYWKHVLFISFHQQLTIRHHEYGMVWYVRSLVYSA